MDRLDMLVTPARGTMQDYLCANAHNEAQLTKVDSFGRWHVFDDRLVRMIAFSISLKVAALARLMSDDPEIARLERVVQQGFAAGEMFVVAE